MLAWDVQEMLLELLYLLQTTSDPLPWGGRGSQPPSPGEASPLGGKGRGEEKGEGRGGSAPWGGRGIVARARIRGCTQMKS